MVANGALLGSLAGSILELSETYKCGSIVRGLSRRITVRPPTTTTHTHTHHHTQTHAWLRPAAVVRTLRFR